MNYPQTSYSGEIVNRPAGPVAVPAAGCPLTAGPIQYTPAQMPDRPKKRGVFQKLDKVAPLLATTPLTVAARLWMLASGHALGYVPLLSSLSVAAVGCALIGAKAKSKGVVAMCLSVAGGLAAAAVAGNAASFWPTAVAWTAGNTTGYGVMWPSFRAEEHRAEDHQERMDLATLQSNTTIQTELIRGQVALGVAATQANAYVTGEQIKADALRDVSSRIPTPVVPAADPSIFNLSRSGQAALAEPVTMPAAAEVDGIHLAEWLAA